MRSLAEARELLSVAIVFQDNAIVVIVAVCDVFSLMVQLIWTLFVYATSKKEKVTNKLLIFFYVIGVLIYLYIYLNLFLNRYAHYISYTSRYIFTKKKKKNTKKINQHRK